MLSLTRDWPVGHSRDLVAHGPAMATWQCQGPATSAAVTGRLCPVTLAFARSVHSLGKAAARVPSRSSARSFGLPMASTFQYCSASTSTSAASSRALGAGGADRDLAVIGHQAGVALRETGDDMARQFLGAEGRVGHERDIVAAGDRHHVVERRDRRGRAQARTVACSEWVWTMAPMSARAAIGGEMETPFARGLALAAAATPVGSDEHDVGGRQGVVGHAGRRDQHAVCEPRARRCPERPGDSPWRLMPSAVSSTSRRAAVSSATPPSPGSLLHDRLASACPLRASIRQASAAIPAASRSLQDCRHRGLTMSMTRQHHHSADRADRLSRLRQDDAA